LRRRFPPKTPKLVSARSALLLSISLSASDVCAGLSSVNIPAEELELGAEELALELGTEGFDIK